MNDSDTGNGTGSTVKTFLSDFKSFLTPRARKLILLALVIFIAGSLLIKAFPTPEPDDPGEDNGDGNLVLHLFEMGGIAAFVLAVIHARRRWERDEVIAFFASCFLYALLFEDMNIQLSGDYSYNKDAWLVLHNTMLVIVFGWCAIVYCIVLTIERSPVVRNWNPVEKGVVAGFLALSIDLGIDATAFAYGLWYWKEGYFFGVPITNFVGWFAAVFWFVFSTEYLRKYAKSATTFVTATTTATTTPGRRLRARILAIFPDYGGLLLLVGLSFAFLHLLGMK